MPIYQLIPLADNAADLDVTMTQRMPEANRFPLQNQRGWLADYAGTSVELSNFLGITGTPEGVPPSVSPILITGITNYYGRGPADMWEWLKTRFERAP
ncbi:MAG: hypothetical protein V4505_25545 [Pseudomonadota bacterium]